MFRKFADTLLQKSHYAEDRKNISLLYNFNYGKTTLYLTYHGKFYQVYGSGNIQYPSLSGDDLSGWKLFFKSENFDDSLSYFKHIVNHIMHSSYTSFYTWSL